MADPRPIIISTAPDAFKTTLKYSDNYKGSDTEVGVLRTKVEVEYAASSICEQRTAAYSATHCLNFIQFASSWQEALRPKFTKWSMEANAELKQFKEVRQNAMELASLPLDQDDKTDAMEVLAELGDEAFAKSMAEKMGVQWGSPNRPYLGYLVERSEIEKAMRPELTQLAAAHPDDGLVAMAQAHATLNDNVNAVKYASRAHELLPNDVRIARGYAFILYTSGHSEKALSLTEGVVASDPNNFFALATQVGILLDMKRFPETATALETLVSLFPADAYFRIISADTFFNIGNKKAMLEQANIGASLASWWSAAQCFKGWAMIENGMIDAALPVIDQCIRMDPEDGFGHIVRSMALRHLNRDKDCIASAQLGLLKPQKLFSMTWNAYGMLVTANNSLGNYREAIKWGEQRLESEPNAADLLYVIGWGYNKLKDWKKAENYYERGYQLDPHDTKRALEYANVLLNRNKGEKALQLFKDINAKDSSSFEAVRGIFNVFARLSRSPESLPYIQTFIAKNPGTEKGLVLMAHYFASTEPAKENLKKAMEYADKAEKIQPDSTEVMDKKALIFSKMNRLPEALALTTKLVQVKDIADRIKLMHGVILYGLGRYEEGLKYMESIPPDEPAYKDYLTNVLAVTYFTMNNSKKLMAVVDANPDVLSPELMLPILTTLESLGETDRAKRLVAHWLKSKPDDDRLNAYQIWVDRKAPTALDQVVTLLKKNPKSSYLHLAKGMVYVAQNSGPAAIAEFDEALRLDPDNIVARDAKIQIALQSTKPNLASKDVDILAASSPNYGAHLKALLAYFNGRYRESLDFLKVDQKDTRTKTDAQYLLAATNAKMGDLSMAAQNLQRAHQMGQPSGIVDDIANETVTIIKNSIPQSFPGLNNAPEWFEEMDKELKARLQTPPLPPVHIRPAFQDWLNGKPSPVLPVPMGPMEFDWFRGQPPSPFQDTGH